MVATAIDRQALGALVAGGGPAAKGKGKGSGKPVAQGAGRELIERAGTSTCLSDALSDRRELDHADVLGTRRGSVMAIVTAGTMVHDVSLGALPKAECLDLYGTGGRFTAKLTEVEESIVGRRAPDAAGRTVDERMLLELPVPPAFFPRSLTSSKLRKWTDRLPHAASVAATTDGAYLLPLLALPKDGAALATAELAVRAATEAGVHIAGYATYGFRAHPDDVALLASLLDALPPGLVLVRGISEPAAVQYLVRALAPRPLSFFEGEYIDELTTKGMALVPGVDEPPMNLWDVRYKLDQEPLVAGCTCATCEDHTRAYLHHLLVVREILAPMLLAQHNLHQYTAWLATL